jgi:hypothetical protein
MMSARQATVKTGMAVIAGAAAVAGCSPSRDPGAPAAAAAVYRSPEQATLSWLYAMNHKDGAAAVAHFTRAAASQMDWGNGDTSAWPTFSALHCKPVRQSMTMAWVYCTFSESQASAVGNPDTFWTVELERQPDGRWLIDNYGQG